MIKRLLLAILIAFPATMFAQKFGVINTQSLMEGMPEIKEVNEQLQAASKKYEDEFTKLREQFEKDYNDFNALDESTPQTIKDRRMQDLQALDARINQFRQTAQEDLQRQQQQLMAPVQEKVMKAIQTVGEEQGFTFIFENMMPVYTGKDVTDITDTVRTRLGIK